MLGNFSYHNPTKLYFGEDSISNLKTELANYGKNILFVYDGLDRHSKTGVPLLFAYVLR